MVSAYAVCAVTVFAAGVVNPCVIGEVAAISLSESTIRHYINWANLCLRHGCFKEILSTATFATPVIPYALEIYLLIESAKLEFKRSCKMSPFTVFMLSYTP